MMRFYGHTSWRSINCENQALIDANSSVATDEFKSAIVIAEIASENSSVTTSDKSAISPTASEKSVRKSAIASHKFSKQITYLCPPICLHYQM